MQLYWVNCFSDGVNSYLEPLLGHFFLPSSPFYSSKPRNHMTYLYKVTWNKCICFCWVGCSWTGLTGTDQTRLWLLILVGAKSVLVQPSPEAPVGSAEICLWVFYDLSFPKQWFSNFNILKNHLGICYSCKCCVPLMESLIQGCGGGLTRWSSG